MPEQIELLEHHAHAGAQGVNIGVRIGYLDTAHGNGSRIGLFEQVYTSQKR